MAIQGINESSLATSEIFAGLSKVGANGPKEKAVAMIKNGKHLVPTDIEATYLQVMHMSNSLSRAGVKAFQEGRVVLLFNNVPALSVTQALPFITFKTGEDYKTYVFTDRYIRVTKDGDLDMQPTILNDLLISAAVANKLKTNYSSLVANQYLQATFMEAYVRFVRRIIDRDYSMATMRTESEIIQYYISHFFLSIVFGSLDSHENIHTVCQKRLKNIDELKLEEIERLYDEANPSKFSELLELIKSVSPRMNTLGLGTFLSSWVNYYYAPSLLAIDTMEYLIFMVLTILHGNNIISIQASSMVKEIKDIKSLREELLKLLEE